MQYSVILQYACEMFADKNSATNIISSLTLLDDLEAWKFYLSVHTSTVLLWTTVPLLCCVTLQRYSLGLSLLNYLLSKLSLPDSSTQTMIPANRDHRQLLCWKKTADSQMRQKICKHRAAMPERNWFLKQKPANHNVGNYWTITCASFCFRFFRVPVVRGKIIWAQNNAYCNITKI